MIGFTRYESLSGSTPHLAISLPLTWSVGASSNLVRFGIKAPRISEARFLSYPRVHARRRLTAVQPESLHIDIGQGTLSRVQDQGAVWNVCAWVERTLEPPPAAMLAQTDGSSRKIQNAGGGQEAGKRTEVRAIVESPPGWEHSMPNRR